MSLLLLGCVYDVGVVASSPEACVPALEVCNGADDDCDGLVDDDDGVTGAPTWYADADGDGYGGDDFVGTSCIAGAGQSTISGDCDDTEAAAYPDAVEVCDDIDNDCDGLVDGQDGAGDPWYPDADGDGDGDENRTEIACGELPGHVAEGGDCDDGEVGVNPDATEVCDDVDNDCDGLVDDEDDDVSEPSTWYADADGDGRGDPETTAQVG